MAKKTAKKTKDGLILTQRSIMVRLAINPNSANGSETVKEKKLNVSVFPKGIPLSTVRVKTHGTFNMGDYSSVQSSVEIEDTTISNPEARKALMAVLAKEAMDETARIAKEAAQRLFNKTLSMEE